MKDEPVDAPEETAEPCAALVLDGIFLHRPELAGSWEFSVYLDTPFAVSVARCAARDGTSPEPDDASNHRYVEGQRLYLTEAKPRERASVVVDNSRLDAPRIVRTSHLGRHRE